MKKDALQKSVSVMLFSVLFLVIIDGWVTQATHNEGKPRFSIAQAARGGVAALTAYEKTKNETTSTTGPRPDEIDSVMQAARDGVAALTAYEKTKTDEIGRLVVQAQERVNQSFRDDAALAKNIGTMADSLEKLNLEKKALQDQIIRKQKELQELQASSAAAAEAASQAAAAANARTAVAPISQGRARAAQLAELIRNNNLTGLTELLKRDLPGSNVDVTELTNSAGLKVTFRINGLTHCISTAQQCTAKSYSLTK